MEERPYELPADIFEAKFKMRVLENGVMPAVKRGRADRDALLVRDFFGADQARGIAGARRRDRRIERMSEPVPERDAGRSGFNV